MSFQVLLFKECNLQTKVATHTNESVYNQVNRQLPYTTADPPKTSCYSAILAFNLLPRLISTRHAPAKRDNNSDKSQARPLGSACGSKKKKKVRAENPILHTYIHATPDSCSLAKIRFGVCCEVANQDPGFLALVKRPPPSSGVCVDTAQHIHHKPRQHPLLLLPFLFISFLLYINYLESV